MPQQDNYLAGLQVNVGAIGATSFAGLFNEFAQDNVVAAGTNQATAFACTAQTIRITSAAAGSGILLPPSAAGLEVLVINHAANAMQVYGKGTDTVDDQTATVGVNQMPNSLVIYTCATSGNWYSEGLSTGFATSLGLQTLADQDGITARAGGGQALGTPITKLMNRVATVVNPGDSVTLPVSAAGLQIVVFNGTSTSMNVFPNPGGTGTEQINTLGANAALAIANSSTPPTVFYCFTPGQWFTK